MTDVRAPGCVISLKWKALILTSLVLLAVTGSFVGLNYLELSKQFEQRREQIQQQYALQVQGLLDQSSDHLQQLAMTVASFNEVKQLFGAGPAALDGGGLGALWANLELNLGIESVELTAADDRRLAAYGIPGANGQPSADVQEVIRNVAKAEEPKSLIDCRQTCLQYAVAPVLGSGRGTSGTVVLGVSLADLVLEFQRVSGTDLALIVEKVSDEPEPLAERWIPPWQATVVAVTNSQLNMPALRQLGNSGVSLARLQKSTYMVQDGRELETRIFPLSGFGKQERAYLAVIADIGPALSAIRRATQRSLYLGGAGLVLSELILLLVLWFPMSRLKRAAEVLPKLAEGAFPEVHAAISDMRRGKWLRDEVDVLNETAFSLSTQLERLNLEVSERSRDLSERMEEIIRERNFVTHLLETAKAIILTQDAENRIISANSYAQEVTGFSKQELQGMPFVDIVGGGSGSSLAHLHELATGRREDFEEERDLRGRLAGTVNIAWRHSRLGEPKKDNAVILSIGVDITDRKKAELELAWMADHDSLTGLFNRRRFEQELDQALAAAKRYNYCGALLFFDLDQFKYINDTSGHNAGDRLLVGIGESLPRLLRAVDITGRLGGDEFAVILSRATAEEAIKVAEKILAHVREMEFSVGERVHKVSASLGIALFPEHGSNIQDLLTRADLAMYQVKESGRGGWYLFSNSDQTHRLMQERVMWKQRIERALKEQGFALYVQPIVPLNDSTAHHYEVLLRMRAEDGSMIGPVNFIEVAERSGLIHSIDRIAMTEAIRFQALARDRGRRITFTVNLSAHAFNDPGLLGHLKDLLDETGLDPRQLIFEMTETAALADLVAARRLMEAISEIGCQFALDDFGTGFSTFYYLRQQLPFAFIKIDGSFIRNLADRPDDQILVKHMGDIAREFDKKSIAEHVEDARTLELLKEYKIDYAQGYYTGRPMEIGRLLDDDWQEEAVATRSA